RAGSAAQKQAWLAPAIAGEKVLAAAYAEQGSRYDLARVATRAERSKGGYTLTGEKHQVWGGQLADAYVVSARVAGEPGDRDGIALFLVPANAQGVSTVRQVRVDSLNTAIVRFAGVKLTDADVLGSPEQGFTLLAEA